MATRQRAVAAAGLAGVLLATASCASQDEPGEDEGSGTTLRIATVENRDLVRLRELSQAYTSEHPGVTLEWDTLEEGRLRQQVMTDIATQGGRYDIVTIGTYEAPIWAEREWLRPLDALPADYAEDDLLPTVREALSHDGTLYAAPFYGESAITMYRTDLFEQAGLTMPDSPTWDDIAGAAERLDQGDVNGICLRGRPGWGENVALLTAMANAEGGRWFTEDWTPDLRTGAWTTALQRYADLLTEHGPDDATSLGYTDVLSLFQEGRCAIWVDASVAGSALVDPQSSQVADSVGFALAPDAGQSVRSSWLWSWALAVPESSDDAGPAQEFVTWATSTEYTDLVARSDGWANVPPGTRTSLYENEEYREAAPFADATFASIEESDPEQPTTQPVPYTGIQYVSIPSFPSIGTAVGNRVAAVLDGSVTVEQALEDAQWVTEKVIAQSERTED
ncbi:sugar ABC transporter substrate-binding protein [Phycicoccus sp. CSK15P-2]|uniref:ABC transporter substrate-binding protein n=1 Tax=Phycicoccus sp. CSK15P-2 TaxID=2807627 RepID=UPI001950BBD9|nr:sugar ABC transporter substrate-binding protein [Phycicoccus sp. CSK15P-2]MBM6404362.1 sugar ABC transporter substrate-binding protein [Phycicoccus sp. CSK15P-2]